MDGLVDSNKLVNLELLFNSSLRTAVEEHHQSSYMYRRCGRQSNDGPWNGANIIATELGWLNGVEKEIHTYPMERLVELEDGPLSEMQMSQLFASSAFCDGSVPWSDVRKKSIT